jgi:hypothetical protein
MLRENELIIPERLRDTFWLLADDWAWTNDGKAKCPRKLEPSQKKNKSATAMHEWVMSHLSDTVLLSLTEDWEPSMVFATETDMVLFKLRWF